MLRSVLCLLVIVLSTTLFPRGTSAKDPSKEGTVIAIQRGGGFVDPNRNPFAHYWFTLNRDGSWEVKPLKGDSRKGKLEADTVEKWTKLIREGGFDRLKSNPALGAADESYMDITIHGKDKKEQKRIPLEEKLSQALEKKIAELARLDR